MRNRAQLQRRRQKARALALLDMKVRRSAAHARLHVERLQRDPVFLAFQPDPEATRQWMERFVEATRAFLKTRYPWKLRIRSR
jgi:hypothetical protein